MKSLVSPFHVRLPFTVPLVLRYCLITLLLTGFALGCSSSIAPLAHAASHAATATKHVQHTTDSQQPPPVMLRPGTHQSSPFIPNSTPVNGTGILPFYKYISHKLNDHQTWYVNVATGNLVIESKDLHIAGTGVDLGVASYYNSQASTATACYHNTPWSVDLPNVFLVPQGLDGSTVILCGPSG